MLRKFHEGVTFFTLFMKRFKLLPYGSPTQKGGEIISSPHIPNPLCRRPTAAFG